VVNESAPEGRRRVCLAWGGGLLLGAMGACRDGAPRTSFHALNVTGSDWGHALSLPDTEGRARSLADWRGQVVVLFFGFTHCPDVCPTALATLAAAMGLLGAQADRVQGVFVTLDPERDGPVLLQRYVAAFHPRFVALRGDTAATAAAARAFKVFHQKVAGTQPSSYTLDHTAALYVLDPQGRLRLYVRHGMAPSDLAADIRQLLAGH
jgi:protein SCO1/2